MKLLYDFFPILLFFVAYQMSGILVATAVAIVASFAQVGLFYARHRRFEPMHLVSLGLITVLGGLTLWLADKQFIQDFIATSRMEIDQARLLTLHAAWKMDTLGKRAARQEISMIKVVAANVVMNVLDRSIQAHGALGMTDDTPLALMWRYSRMLRLADGPDEVHKMVIARREVGRQVKKAAGEA